MPTIAISWANIVGHLATIFIVLGVMQKSVKRMRVCMVLGSLAFVIYGIGIGALPVIFANIVVGLVSARYLYKDFKNKD
jgi:uncharacterized protein with PQ loop repeat